MQAWTYREWVSFSAEKREAHPRSFTHLLQLESGLFQVWIIIIICLFRAIFFLTFLRYLIEVIVKQSNLPKDKLSEFLKYTVGLHALVKLRDDLIESGIRYLRSACFWCYRIIYFFYFDVNYFTCQSFPLTIKFCVRCLSRTQFSSKVFALSHWCESLQF
jgi:hypothetical protein